MVIASSQTSSNHTKLSVHAASHACQRFLSRAASLEKGSRTALAVHALGLVLADDHVLERAARLDDEHRVGVAALRLARTRARATVKLLPAACTKTDKQASQQLSPLAVVHHHGPSYTWPALTVIADELVTELVAVGRPLLYALQRL
jgi:hypothetical protein